MDVHTAQALTQLGAAATGPIVEHRALLLQHQRELERLATEYGLRAGLEEQKAQREVEAKRQEIAETQERVRQFVVDHYPDLERLYGKEKARIYAGLIGVFAEGGEKGLGKVGDLLEVFEEGIHKKEKADVDLAKAQLEHTYRLEQIDRAAAHAKERALIARDTALRAAEKRAAQAEKKDKPVKMPPDIVRAAFAKFQTLVREAKGLAAKGDVEGARAHLKKYKLPLDEKTNQVLLNSGLSEVEAAYKEVEQKIRLRRVKEEADRQTKAIRKRAEEFERSLKDQARRLEEQKRILRQEKAEELYRAIFR